MKKLIITSMLVMAFSSIPSAPQETSKNVTLQEGGWCGWSQAILRKTKTKHKRVKDCLYAETSNKLNSNPVQFLL